MARKKTGDRPPRRRRLWNTALVAVALCGTTAAGLAVHRALSDDGDTDRVVTIDEAGRLAASRLTLYQASPVAVSLTAAEGGGVTIRVEAVVDYRTHRAVGSYRVTGAAGPLDRGLIVWDGAGLGLAPAPAGGTDPAWQQAEHIPRSGWSSRAYTADPLDSGLRLLIQLGADRPDNPMLLAQSGARWLGRDRIEGRTYDRFSGPRAQDAVRKEAEDTRSPLTYWVDGDGGLRRATMRMPGLGTPTTIEITGRDDRARMPEAPWIAG
ncbi:hypothetical protein [Embleya scabrispora]|uniref:hypothetical protein n=1 Tax=Embleya scabrispora TaxID=159449 RepID=UPI00037D2157|nr:hypothetical protein [Embleya scabrispora]MYS81214.1 hypothetical protein [Streptomyces sp. SID5474]